MTEEVWVRSPSFSFLQVSSHGRLLIDEYDIEMPRGGVKHIKTKPTLGCKVTVRKKYQRYLFINKKHGVKNKKVHQLIAEAFLGPKPFEGAVVMHLDDNPLNNRVENLRWATQQDNLNTESFLEYCRNR